MFTVKIKLKCYTIIYYIISKHFMFTVKVKFDKSLDSIDSRVTQDFFRNAKSVILDMKREKEIQFGK